LFKESKTHIHKDTKTLVDTGFVGIQKIHTNSELPKKRSKKNPLTLEDKKRNQEISSERVICENIIGKMKRYKILSEKYRNRRKRFGLRFNLLAGLHNYEIDH